MRQSLRIRFRLWNNNTSGSTFALGTATVNCVGTDAAGNALDGNADGSSGDDYVTSFGHGTRLSYTDRNGDTVTLALTGGGVMELTRAPDGEGRDLRLLNLNATSTRNVLTGTVKKPRTAGDGMTSLNSITPTTGYTKRGDLLNPSKFKIGIPTLAAAVVDDLLTRGELSAIT